ncbi:Ferric-pseudobactin BN7/BN8 receptor precursor [compost metagenome]
MTFRKTALALACALHAGLLSTVHAAEADQALQLDASTIVGQADGAAAERDSYQAKPSSAATRLELTPRQTPQSVSTITRAQLDDFKLTSVNDALKYTPGIAVQEVETDRTYFTARGFDITNFQYDGIGAPFVYGNLDGSIDTAPFERIEVVRGANGLMSGTGNPSATINFVRKRPTATPQARVDLTAGSWDKRRIDTDVSGPLTASGNVRGRLVYAHEDKNSYLDRYSREKNVFHGVLEADLSERTTLSLGHTLQKTAADSPMWGALPLYFSDGSATDFSRSTSTAADWAFWDNQEQRTFVELEHDLGNGWQAKGVLTRVEKEGDARLFYVYGTPDAASGLGLFSYPSLYEDDNRQWLADLYVSGPFALLGREHELVAGVNWSKSELDDVSHYGQGIGTPLPPLQDWRGDYPLPAFDAAVDGSSFEDKQKSAYAATRLSLADPLTLIAGARATWVDSEGESYGRARSREDDAITPYAGLVYDLSEQYSVYASYTEIFDPQTRLDASGERLDPVEGRSFELGVKGELFDGRLNVAAATFKTYQDNMAESAGFVGGRQIYDGVDYLSEGYELELSGELLPGLQASAGYTFVDVQDAEHRHAKTYAPKHLLRAATTYRLPQLPQLKVGANLSWQDAIHRDVSLADGSTGKIEQDSYALVGLMASYDIDPNWSVAANLNNLTDEKYISSLYWEQGYYGAPRNASMTVSWKY